VLSPLGGGCSTQGGDCQLATNLKLLCRFHHSVKTFYTGIGGWADRQLPDGTVEWTSPSSHTYSTEPGGALFFPQLAVPTATLELLSLPTLGNNRGLMMPTRRRTRADEHAARIAHERAINEARFAACKDPPPPSDRSRARHRSWQPFLERDRIKRSPAGQRLVQPVVPGGAVEGLGLGLTIAGDQIHAPVAAGKCLGLQYRQQHLRVAAPAMGPVGPNPLELGSIGVISPKCATGDGYAIDHPDKQAAVRRRQLGGRNA